ncbi:MAG: RNA polymerase sigma factor [Sphaerochaetaceae bacterium]|jgi:RNA polymerase sigma-70 factor (ECF subfamily)|nr:RNA polymerase sigma factor [Sphaerochaetaceae bacterium]NLO59854.1 RNA polymerase sigma factor [Spirochaetales bacterium]MDD2406287.1 RNA polymerase sigma factor [Sphaerochaetaceae bacterium]MDD3671713.1 RNA polymerase sigma factor [Sphaerochaetaceae bacterium]MDD4260220.1 RNA polymerase sigma factor [Sphaerochaetaceae bacterium]
MEINSSEGKAFRLVYEQVFPVVMRVAYHITYNMDVSEDICQEAFIRFYEKAIVFRSVDEAKYWLIRVTKNMSINIIKRKAREQATVERLKKIPSTAAPNGEQSLLGNETRLLVREAVEKLPEKLKAVLVLKEYADLNYKQIAQILRISESNVKVRVHRARKIMESMLDREEMHVS